MIFENLAESPTMLDYSSKSYVARKNRFGIADLGFGMEHGAWSQKTDDRRQTIDGRTQRSEIRCQRSGVKLISYLRPLTSVMAGFNDFNGFNDLNDLAGLNDMTNNSWLLTPDSWIRRCRFAQ